MRVSTEAQAKKGESLNTQRKQLTEAIKTLGGSVYHWYAGDEHATPDQERAILNQLIEDAKEKKFDAVIVTDTSRWSRDNRKSKEYLEILKNNGIRFFVGTQEYSLYDPFHSLIIGMGVEIEEFFAKQQAYKSLVNRIERAKQGYPSCGKQPYGRKFDKTNKKWFIDEEKKKLIEKIAKLYLEKDIDFETLGKQFRMNPSNLHKILTKRCGDVWPQRFRSERLGIDESVEMKVPRLLSESIIQQIKAKSEARRTWQHGAPKYKYLLSRLIYDADTSHSLTGTTNPAGQRYYKPYTGQKNRYMVNANVIERALLDQLSYAIASGPTFREAVFKASSTKQEAQEIERKKAFLEKQLKRVDAEISRIATVISGLYEFEFKSFMQKMEDKMRSLENERNEFGVEIELISAQLNSLATAQEIEEERRRLEAAIRTRTEQLRQRAHESWVTSGGPLLTLPFEEKRRLVEMIFGGKDPWGRRYGIYIKYIGGNPRKYQWTAHGRLGKLEGWTVARAGEFYSLDTNLYLEDDLKIGEKAAKMVKEAWAKENVELHMSGERHAHYRLRLH